MNDQTPPVMPPAAQNGSTPDPAAPPVTLGYPFSLGTETAADPTAGPAGDTAAGPESGSDSPESAEYEVPRPNERPQLVHSGTYALWMTPGGYYHLTYRRTAGTDPDTGEITGIDGAPDVHLRDLPPHAADMVTSVLDRDTELPPLLQQFFFSGTNPLAGGKMAAMRQAAALMKEGGLDQLMAIANGGGPGAPVE